MLLLSQRFERDILKQLKYLEFNIEDINSILKIHNICINEINVGLKIIVDDIYGISLFDEVLGKQTIESSGLKGFIRKYLMYYYSNLDTVILEKVDLIYESVLYLADNKMKPIINFIKSFDKKHIAKNYVQIDTRNIARALHLEANDKVYIIADMGVSADPYVNYSDCSMKKACGKDKTDKEKIRHIVYLAVANPNSLVDILKYDIINNENMEIQYENGLYLTDIVRYTIGLMNVIVAHKIVYTYNNIDSNLLSQIDNNVRLLENS